MPDSKGMNESSPAAKAAELSFWHDMISLMRLSGSILLCRWKADGGRIAFMPKAPSCEPMIETPFGTVELDCGSRVTFEVRSAVVAKGLGLELLSAYSSRFVQLSS